MVHGAVVDACVPYRVNASTITEALVYTKVGVGDHENGRLLAQHRGRRRVVVDASAGVYTGYGRDMVMERSYGRIGGVAHQAPRPAICPQLLTLCGQIQSMQAPQLWP